MRNTALYEYVPMVDSNRGIFTSIRVTEKITVDMFHTNGDLRISNNHESMWITSNLNGMDWYLRFNDVIERLIDSSNLDPNYKERHKIIAYDRAMRAWAHWDECILNIRKAIA